MPNKKIDFKIRKNYKIITEIACLYRNLIYCHNIIRQHAKIFCQSYSRFKFPMEINSLDVCARVQPPTMLINGLEPGTCSSKLKIGLCQLLCSCPVLPQKRNGATLLDTSGRSQARYCILTYDYCEKV